MAYDINLIQQPPCGLLNLRAGQDICRRYNAVLGFELPQTPNTATADGQRYGNVAGARRMVDQDG